LTADPDPVRFGRLLQEGLLVDLSAFEHGLHAQRLEHRPEPLDRAPDFVAGARAARAGVALVVDQALPDDAQGLHVTLL